MSPFRQVYDLGCKYWPRLGMGLSPTAISGWLSMGCSAEFDIIPIIEQAHAQGKQIHSWSYFSNQVRAALDERKRVEAKMAEPPKTPEAIIVDEATKARNIAWVIRKLGKQSPHDERWLLAYEARNGAVAL